jgi:glycerol kinase
MTEKFVLSIDNGTTSTRAIIFDNSTNIRGTYQKETSQFFPQPGWVEHDPVEIWKNTQECITGAINAAGLSASDISAIGITNQRETTVIWDKVTGIPVYNAVVWQDTRTQKDIEVFASRDLAEPDFHRFRQITGLPLASYFSASKIWWILNNVKGVKERAKKGELLFGTIDSWLLWNLTGEHKTDVTNASRTLLMDLQTLSWDQSLCDFFDIPMNMLPAICASSSGFGVARGVAEGIPVSGILGDQQAATFGQACFVRGSAKSTYGTGNFLIVHTGDEIQYSESGMITTVAYQYENQPAKYALEGSVAVSGSLIQWLRDNLGIISQAAETEELAISVADNGGAYIIPAFSGLFAPYWRPDARGAIVGLTRYVTKAHLARAALEAVAFQCVDLVHAAQKDTNVKLMELKVDGGMTANNTLMQIQADLLGIPVVRPRIMETTALGAAFAAGLFQGVWESIDQLSALWSEDTRWIPTISDDQAHKELRVWHKAISKSTDWVDEDSPQI